MYRRFLKRGIDIAVSLICLVVCSPFLLVIAIGVRLASPGPAIFCQSRVGRHGKIFKFLKFRSLPVDTKDLASDQLGAVDIPAFGRLIRRTSLDELPQLVNILKGDMSLVGPRPCLSSQKQLVELRKESGASSCRPGLTGLAQVNSYSGMTASAKASYDAAYASRITFAADMLIIFRTVSYLFKSPPVY